ncbi:MAG: hypothetical protein NC394_03920 [Bacteroides sp.]|nr:hypothetical protein [Bacteroides sp.]
MIESRADVIGLLNAYLVTQHECTHQSWMPGSEGWSGKKEAIYSNGVVFGKFRENDEATMQMLKIGVEDRVLKEEIKLEIEHYIKSLEQLEKLDCMQEKILSSQKLELKKLQTISVDEWIEKNCGWIERDSQEITNSEKRVLLYLYYSFKNFKYERNHPYCSDVDELEKNIREFWISRVNFKNTELYRWMRIES